MLSKIKQKMRENEFSEMQVTSESIIKKYAHLPIEDIYKELDSSKNGINDIEAIELLEKYGKNTIELEKSNTMLSRLVHSFINPFNIVLFVVAIISYITDVVISDTPDYLTIIILITLILLSSLIAFFQGERSNSAASKLSDLIANKADVIRNGQLKEIDIDEAVVGDIIKLSAGDIIPCDIRFTFTKDAFISQAALTGESNPVEKFTETPDRSEDSLTDLSNIGFTGSNMISGTALAIVVATGNDTYFASMAKSIANIKTKNSFEKGIESISKILLGFMVIMVPIIFFVNWFIKNDFLSALVFAISVAVGLTPEMLPMIMTSTLAKGAVNMSKQKTIVKDLSAIQTFGEMDILCTDKTGTLTEDKIILEKYMDVNGEEDSRILKHGYLNSYFQTGLKNLIDIAIIERGNKNNLKPLQTDYEVIDEIPFDFSRRRMSVVLKDQQGKAQLITKGAVEEMMSICSYIDVGGQVYPLDNARKEKAMEVYEKHNHDGLRIIAIAQRNEIGGIETFGVKDENKMVLLGFIGFLDPPKESSKEAIKALKAHGVRTVVLTGDSEGVAIKVCDKVGVRTDILFLGIDVEKMTDEELKEAVKTCDLFAKLSPNQKLRVVKAFQENGHSVGYMGDGINDAPALRQSDVGISVDSAVDIAKETANIILLEKDLMVLEKGVVEGRKTFGNINKYIKMAASGNFGNMFSVLAASIFLPFLPMLPIHILVQNLLSDLSQIGIPFDNVDEEYMQLPKKWDAKSVMRFMVVMGPLSSIFDILCFIVLWYVIGANSIGSQALFHSGWFVFGTISQVLVVHMIRTQKIPFIQSNSSLALMISTIAISIIVLIIGFTKIALSIDMQKLPLSYLPWLAILILGYCLATQFIKGIYIKKFNEWL